MSDSNPCSNVMNDLKILSTRLDYMAEEFASCKTRVDALTTYMNDSRVTDVEKAAKVDRELRDLSVVLETATADFRGFSSFARTIVLRVVGTIVTGALVGAIVLAVKFGGLTV